MRTPLLTIAIACSAILFVSCGTSKSSSTLPSEKSDDCLFADDVCKEAESFQVEYYKMGEEEKKQMTPVLNSYINHCETARKDCKKSQR